MIRKNHQICLAIVLLMVIQNNMQGQSNPLGLFRDNQDIGAVKHEGNVSYHGESQEYLIEGSGANMWFADDQFQFLWKSIQGDFILRAKVSFVGDGVDPHRKLGWMVRNNFHSSSEHVNASMHGDGLVSLQYRKKAGGDTEEMVSTDSLPDIIQLERQGNKFIMGTAKMGQPLVKVTLENLDLNNELFVGLYVCSHNADVVEKAIENETSQVEE